MIKILAAGAIVFIETNGERQYLLLKNISEDGGHWVCPKGMAEEDEDYLECAKREVIEETGIVDFEVIPGFKYKHTYKYEWSDTLYGKTVFYYLFKIKSKEIKLSPEQDDYIFVDPKTLNKEKYKYVYELIEQAEKFLEKKR